MARVRLLPRHVGGEEEGTSEKHFNFSPSVLSFQPIVRTLQDLGPASLLCFLPATGCTTCNVALPSESGLTMHEEGEQHRRNLEFAKLLQVVAVEKK